MSPKEIKSFVKELSEEMAATQRAIALSNRKLSTLEEKVDRILNQHEKRYVEIGYRG